jgi:hypothetical protein
MYQAFQPPLYWQQFEDLTEAVFPYIYGHSRPQKVGRPGQAQNGVDVYGKCLRTKRLIGIQCKRMDELDENNQHYPGGAITTKILRNEYGKALGFAPPLHEWILATTAKRDEPTQRAARFLDAESQSQGRFAVRVWFWDDYVSNLNQFGDLQHQYYRNVLNVQNAYDLDKMTLELYAHAFSRPAFQDAFHDENPDDFLQAIKDTIRALNTGELLDRETRHVIRKAIGGRRTINQAAWRRACDTIYGRLRELKDAFQAGLQDGEIKKQGRYLQFTPRLKLRLETLRSSCLVDLNAVLSLAGLDTV